MNKQQNTALMLAAKKGYASVLQLLIDAHADIEMVDDMGKSAEALCTSDASREVFIAIREAKEKSIRDQLIREQNAAVHRYVSDRSVIGIRVNILQRYRQQEEQENEDNMDYVPGKFPKGVFPDSFILPHPESGLRPIDIAMRQRDVPMMTLLLEECGASVKDLKGNSSNGCTIVMQYVLEKRMASYPETARSRAQEDTRLSILRLLVRFGCDVLARNKVT